MARKSRHRRSLSMRAFSGALFPVNLRSVSASFLGGAEGRFAQAHVGPAGAAKYDIVRDSPPPTVYEPIRPRGGASLQVLTQLEPAAFAALLRNELPRVHPAFRMTGVTLQSTLVDNTLVRERL